MLYYVSLLIFNITVIIWNKQTFDIGGGEGSWKNGIEKCRTERLICFPNFFLQIWEILDLKIILEIGFKNQFGKSFLKIILKKVLGIYFQKVA